MKAMPKVMSQVDTSVAEDVISMSPSIKVCMHVLECLRTDGRVLREATALVEAGYTVSIVDIEGERNCPVKEDMDGIHVHHVITPGWFDHASRCNPRFLAKAASLFFRSIMRLMRIQADIYQAHDVKALPATYVAARLRRKPLIFDAHELPLADTSVRWRGLNRITRYLLNSMVLHCAGVITVSPPIAEEISKRYHYPKVSLIRNIPAYQVVQKSDRLRQHLGFGSHVRIALYQGNIQQDRELHRLVRAAAFFEPDTVIVLMGKGIGDNVAELETLARSEGVTDRIRIIPPVPYTELLDWTASADIGLILYSPGRSLNVRMCLPNKLFEYMMAGLPILATSLDAVADVLNTYKAGRVVSSLEPGDLGTVINEMLADHDALSRMRNNSLAAVQHDLCWQEESRKLIHLYRNILG